MLSCFKHVKGRSETQKIGLWVRYGPAEYICSSGEFSKMPKIKQEDMVKAMKQSPNVGLAFGRTDMANERTSDTENR